MTIFRRRLVTGGLASAAVLAALVIPTTGPLAGLSKAINSPVGSYLAGRFAESQDDWRSAARFMGDALAADPKDADLQRRTLLLRVGEGDIADALPLATALFTANAETPLSALLLAVDHLKNNRIAEADAAAARIRQDGMGRVVASLAGAWIEVAGGKTDAALARIEPLGRVEGMKALHGLHAALINDLAGRDEVADRHYRAIMDPDAPLRVVQLYGNFLGRHGRGDEARALYTGFRDRNPDTVAVEPLLAALDGPGPVKRTVATPVDGLAEAMFDIGSALQHERADDHSLLYARLSLHLRPDLALARLLLADLLADRPGDGDGVAEYRALENDPVLGRMARLRMAETLAVREKHEEAITLLRALDAEQPERTRAIVRLADLLRSEERWDEAIAAYSAAIGRIGTPEERHWPILYSRGIAYERTNRWPEAEADFKAALALRPEEPFVLNYLGYSWVDRGINLDEAKRMIERAVALRPRDGYIVDSLGWALYRLGDFEGAVRNLERAVELKPVDSTINDHLGDAYWRVGRRNEARFQWLRAERTAEEEDAKERIRVKLDKGLPDPQTAGTGATSVR